MFNNFSKNHAIYEIMWENMIQPDRPQMTILYSTCALCACWITKGTDMQLEYVILTAFPQQQWYANTPQYFVCTFMPCIVDIH
jgi:hypothetical protein